jgi:outer membrane protein assembly factor BamB
MSLIRFALLIAGTGMASAAAIAADWPQWRGPNRDDISKDTGLLKTWPKEGPKLLWTYDDAGVGYSSPAVVGDKLFVLGAKDPDNDDKEFLLCLSTKDGKQLWRTDLETGKGKYANNWGSGPRSTPTVDGDFVYVLGARGDLNCCKTANGEKVWSLNFVKDLGGSIPGWGYCESVLIDGDRLLCTPGGQDGKKDKAPKGTIACLNKKTGAVEWRSTDLTEKAAYASIIIDNFGVKQYVTMVPSGVVGIRASDGKLLWKSPAGKNGTAVIPTPIVFEQFVFATSGYGSGCGVVELTADAKDGVTSKDKFLGKVMQNHHGGVVRVDKFIYGFSDKGGWMCLDFLKLDADHEDPVWKSSKLDKGSLTYADGHFYCYGQGKGTCVLLAANPKEWAESGRFEIPKKTQFPRKSGAIWTHPVVANGKLFLRDHELIFCYDIKALD